MAILGLLSIAQSGLKSQQQALEVTGENIANVNTPGYSRQRALLQTAPTAVTPGGFPLGTGVEVNSIERSYDQFLQTQITNGNSAFGQSTTSQAFMQRVEPMFNELTADGLGTAMQDFFNAWQELSVDPQGTAQRQAVLYRSQELTDKFHQLNSFLNSLKTDANQQLVTQVTDINNMTSGIASLNEQIKQTELLAGNANELRDQRDKMVQDLANKVGIRYMEQPDGTLTVSLTTSEMLVSGGQAAQLSTAINSGSGLYDVMITPYGGSAPINITSAVGGPNNSLGEIGGTLKVRDSLTSDMLAKLDELAFTLASEVNAAHTTGFGLNGSTGLDFFVVAPQAGYSNAIELSLSSTADIAAASVDPASGGVGNNVNALKIADIKEKSVSTTLGNTTLVNFYNAYAGVIGLDVQKAEQANQRSEMLLTQLTTLRESTAGVSLDEELTLLIKYQKAYQASAKLVNTATEMLDTLMSLIR